MLFSIHSTRHNTQPDNLRDRATLDHPSESPKYLTHTHQRAYKASSAASEASAKEIKEKGEDAKVEK